MINREISRDFTAVLIRTWRAVGRLHCTPLAHGSPSQPVGANGGSLGSGGDGGLGGAGRGGLGSGGGNGGSGGAAAGAGAVVALPRSISAPNTPARSAALRTRPEAPVMASRTLEVIFGSTMYTVRSAWTRTAGAATVTVAGSTPTVARAARNGVGGVAGVVAAKEERIGARRAALSSEGRRATAARKGGCGRDEAVRGAISERARILRQKSQGGKAQLKRGAKRGSAAHLRRPLATPAPAPPRRSAPASSCLLWLLCSQSAPQAAPP